MSTALSPQEAEEFANQVRTFLESNTSSGRGRDLSAAREFQGRLAEAGFAGIPFPKEYGGAGLTLEHERIFRQVAQGFPMMTGELVISHGMCLPVLNEFGTDEQKRKFMPDNISAKTVWCQMFSEPGAGSDVASLQTKAERMATSGSSMVKRSGPPSLMSLTTESSSLEQILTSRSTQVFRCSSSI